MLPQPKAATAATAAASLSPAPTGHLTPPPAARNLTSSRPAAASEEGFYDTMDSAQALAPRGWPYHVTSSAPGLGLGVPLLLLLSSAAFPRLAEGTCRFPEFLQRDTPWAASYGPDSRLVMYVKGNYMTISEQLPHSHRKFDRKCERSVPDGKFLISHQENADNKVSSQLQYLCVKFIKRSDNIVQMKVSSTTSRQSLELCEDRSMAMDRWPIVQMTLTPEQKVPCPFAGGYNVNFFYPNDTAVCQETAQLMRMESDCEKGDGIVFDFRHESCIPPSLPRNIKQQAHCIAHWTQGSQTFIILQLALSHRQTWCLRISDPLNDIGGGYLMLDLVCDTADVIADTRNFFRLAVTKKVYATTCEDEIESNVCQEMKQYCSHHNKQLCAKTCGACRTESESGNCAFEETYRGLWVESSASLSEDRSIIVDPYTLFIDGYSYTCLKRLEIDKNDRDKDRRVLVRIEENGCYPRYVCLEMQKESSSVMAFRLGDRHVWPLASQERERLERVCSPDSFQTRTAVESRYHQQRPQRLLVKAAGYSRVPCRLPRRLQDGIAFREEGQSCGGCLLYKPDSLEDGRFLVQPHNCSTPEERGGGIPLVPPRLATIEYSCLATKEFRNNTRVVITKTNTYGDSWGQYLAWAFTPDNHIIVIKTADTYLFEMDEVINQDLIKAQFTIVRDEAKEKCKNLLANPMQPFLPAHTATRPREDGREWVVTVHPPTPGRGAYPESEVDDELVVPELFNSTPEAGDTYRFSTRGPHGEQMGPVLNGGTSLASLWGWRRTSGLAPWAPWASSGLGLLWWGLVVVVVAVQLNLRPDFFVMDSDVPAAQPMR